MKRTALLRRAPKPWRRSDEDKVTAADYYYVASRDLAVGGCVMAHLDSQHTCRNAFGDEIPPDGEFQIDHVDNGGVGRRGPSERWNLVRLWPWDHRVKTDNARLWRPRLRKYLERVEGVAHAE